MAALRGLPPGNAEIQVCNSKEHVCDFGRIAPGLERGIGWKGRHGNGW
jgi:hypothetical protein